MSGRTSGAKEGGATAATGAAPAYADTSAVETALITGDKEVLPASEKDAYADGVTPDAELRARTTTARKDVEKEIAARSAGAGLSTTTPRDLTRADAARQQEEPTGPSRMDDPLNQVFHEGDQVSIKIANPKPKKDTSFATTGYEWQGAGIEHLSKIVTIVPGTQDGDYSFVMSKDHSEAEVTDPEVIAFMDWKLFEGNHENFKDLPEGQQIAIGRYFLYHSSGDNEGRTRDRLQIFNMINGATGEGGLPQHLSEPNAYVEQQLRSQGTSEERRKAKAAWKKATEGVDDPDVLWNMAYRSKDASSPSAFGDAVAKGKDNKSDYERIEARLLPEEGTDPATIVVSNGQTVLTGILAVKPKMQETYDTGVDDFGQDTVDAKVLTRGAELETNRATLQSLENTDDGTGYTAYLTARGIATGNTTTRAAYDAAKAQHAMVDNDGTLTKAKKDYVTAKDREDRFTAATQSEEWKTLQKEKARISTLTGPAKQTAQTKYDADFAAFGAAVTANKDLGADAWTALQAGETGITAYTTTLSTARTTAKTKFDRLKTDYEEKDELSGYTALRIGNDQLTDATAEAHARLDTPGGPESETELMDFAEQQRIKGEGGLISQEVEVIDDIDVQVDDIDAIQAANARLAVIEAQLGKDGLSKDKRAALITEQSQLKADRNRRMIPFQNIVEINKKIAAADDELKKTGAAAATTERKAELDQKRARLVEQLSDFTLSEDADYAALATALETGDNAVIKEQKKKLTAARALHVSEAARLGERYLKLDSTGHHDTRLATLEQQRQAIVNFDSAFLEAYEHRNKEAMDQLVYPRHKDGTPVFDDLPEFGGVVLTPEAEAKWQEEHSGYAKTMKTVDKVIAPFTKGGEALSAVSEGVTSVDSIADVIKGDENTAGTAQVTAIHSEKAAKRAALAAERAKRQDIKTSLREFINALREREQTTIQTALAEGITGEKATRKARMENRYVSVVNGAAFADEYTPDNKGALTESQVAKTDAEAEKIAAQAQIQAGRASAVMV